MAATLHLVRTTGLLVITALLGWFDYATGPDIGFSLFYLVPVVTAAWFDGGRAAALVALVASVGWFIADYLWHPTKLAVTSWNSFTRFSIFLSIGLLIAHLRTKQQDLERSNERLESFTRSVSHDLRSPLIHIGRYAELLGERAAALDEQGNRHLGEIARAATDGLQLVDDLLRFAQVQSADIVATAVNLNDVVTGVRTDLEPGARNRRIRWHIDDLPTVKGDPAMIRVVMRNLLDNAIKYTRPCEEAIIEVTSFDQATNVVIAVRDNGVGFDPHYKHKLFRVFERLHSDDQFEGTGIGLALVREIIVRHGGNVWADARPEGGATFYIALPRTT
jgi:light-regulated signal transduction histidine kinase (bacteriophytochrome)